MSIFSTPLGNIHITVQEKHLVRLVFASPHTVAVPTPPLDGTIAMIHAELNRYFTDPQHVFTFPFYLQGTAFQEKVWRALQTIPMGHVVSYHQLAQALGSSARAVGNACRANPLPIVVPCHRVVAKNHIGGYCGNRQGEKIAIKQWLLNHENATRLNDFC